MGPLEKQAFKFWSLMQQLKQAQFPVVSEYARSIELPTLAASTEWPLLAERIEKELSI